MMEHLGHYTIVGVLGASRMGEVFRAQDTRIGRTVAIKLLPFELSENPVLLEGILKDAARASGLSHANVAGFLEHGEREGRVYLVFEYAAGDKLKAAIAGRPLNVRRAVDFGIQMADALAEAHSLGVVHGDLKPESVVVTPKGRPKILDFGFSRWTAGGPAREAAALALPVDSSAVVSTIPYMSPEQAIGEPADGRTDIFSLGVMLYEMLTGKSPFASGTTSSTLVQILRHQPPPPSTVNPQVPASLDHVISRSLAKSLDVRYSNAALLATDLRQVAREMDTQQEAAVDAPVPAPAPRKRRTLMRVGLLAALLAAGASWVWRDNARAAFRRWAYPQRPPVVALVPFELEGADASRAYFASGFADDLGTRLAQVPGITVVGRSFLRDRRAMAPAEVGRQARAPLMIGGTLLPEGDTLRVGVRLVDTADGRELWSRRFTGSMKGIVALQAEIGEQVARELNVPLGPSAGRDRAALRQVDVSGYDLYLQGTDAASRRDYARAAALFEEAVAADVTLAEAHAALALTLAAEQEMAGEVDSSVQLRITKAAGAAVAADPDLADAQLAMGMAENGLGEVLAHFRRAVELDSSHASAYHAIGDELSGIDPARATTFYDRSLAVDDRLFESHRDRANALASLGRFDESLRDIARGEAVSAAAWWWGGMRARVHFDQALYDKGLAIAADPPAGQMSGPLLLAYAGALALQGRGGEARALASEFRSRYPGACSVTAFVAALDHDEGRTAEAAAEAARIARAAAAPGAMPALHTCAAMAAAAIGDVAGASAWLRRIAASEPAFRYWVRNSHGNAADVGLARRWYPWSRITAQPAVTAAVAEIDQVRTRLRSEAENALAGLPPPPR